MHQGKLLIIGNRLPEPQTTAAGNRMIQLIRTFLEGGYLTKFATSSNPGKHSAKLEEWRVECRKIELNNASFDRWIGTWEPDIVLFDRFITEEQFGWRVTRSVPRALRILDTEDLHSLRLARRKVVSGSITDSVAQVWREQEVTFRELAALYRSDLSLLISPYEMDWLRREVGMDRSLLHHLPFMIEEPKPSQTAPWDDRMGFVAIGNGKHEPNNDSFRWLVTEIWPLIRDRLPEAKLKIYGAYLQKDILALHNPALGIGIMGWTNDLQTALGRARVQLAPLRFGAGLKGKLLDSMKLGTPSVTTQIGAEGMRGTLAWNGLIADTPADFADAAVRLYTERRIWEQAQKQGNLLMETFYLRSHHEPPFLKRIQDLQTHLPRMRRENLIGAMLRHHRMASTENLGKWIAVKKDLLEISGS